MKEQLSLTEEVNSRNDQDIYVGERKNAKELKLAFSEFYLNLIIIQDYQKINMTGFQKINKKFDKNFYCDLGKEWFDMKVKRSDLDDSSDVKHLLERVETLFTTELEKGDRKKAMSRLRVPPFESKKTDWTTLAVGFMGGCFLVLVFVIIASSMIMHNSRRVPSNNTEMLDAVQGYKLKYHTNTTIYHFYISIKNIDRDRYTFFISGADINTGATGL